MNNWIIDIDGEKYDYYYTNQLNEGIEKLLSIDTDQYLIVYDNKLDKSLIEEIANNLNKKAASQTVPFDVKEENKNLQAFDSIFQLASDMKLTNHSTIIGIGGGVLGDICGLAASLLFRGIKYVFIPTTIMSATDSSISLKQAVNSRTCKNGIGAYFTSYCILTIYQLFHTLPEREYISGVSESVKNSLCISPEKIPVLAEKLSKGLDFSSEEILYLINDAIEDKMKVLKHDRRERKDGLVLEYGHTVGHALEMITKQKIYHGEGVAFGMLVMAELEYMNHTITKEEYEIQYKLLHDLGVFKNLICICDIEADDILNQMLYDNKRGYVNSDEEEFPLVMLNGLGKSIETNGIKITNRKRSEIYVCIQKVQEYLKNID